MCAGLRASDSGDAKKVLERKLVVKLGMSIFIPMALPC